MYSFMVSEKTIEEERKLEEVVDSINLSIVQNDYYKKMKIAKEKCKTINQFRKEDICNYALKSKIVPPIIVFAREGTYQAVGIRSLSTGGVKISNTKRALTFSDFLFYVQKGDIGGKTVFQTLEKVKLAILLALIENFCRNRKDTRIILGQYSDGTLRKIYNDNKKKNGRLPFKIIRESFQNAMNSFIKDEREKKEKWTISDETIEWAICASDVLLGLKNESVYSVKNEKLYELFFQTIQYEFGIVKEEKDHLSVYMPVYLGGMGRPR